MLHTEMAEDIERGWRCAETKRDNGKVTRRERLAFSAINSRRVEERLPTHFPVGETATGDGMHRGGEERMRCHATAALIGIYASVYPRNWMTIAAATTDVYTAICSFPTACTQESLLCDPRNSRVSILTPPHFRLLNERQNLECLFAAIGGGYCGSDYRAIKSHARLDAFLLFLLLFRTARPPWASLVSIGVR